MPGPSHASLIARLHSVHATRWCRNIGLALWYGTQSHPIQCHCAVPCRSVVEQYFGKKFQAFKPLPKWEFYDYLGWDEQGDGKLFYGIYMQVRQAKVCLQ